MITFWERYFWVQVCCFYVSIITLDWPLLTFLNPPEKSWHGSDPHIFWAVPRFRKYLFRNILPKCAVLQRHTGLCVKCLWTVWHVHFTLLGALSNCQVCMQQFGDMRADAWVFSQLPPPSPPPPASFFLSSQGEDVTRCGSMDWFLQNNLNSRGID